MGISDFVATKLLNLTIEEKKQVVRKVISSDIPVEFSEDAANLFDDYKQISSKGLPYEINYEFSFRDLFVFEIRADGYDPFIFSLGDYNGRQEYKVRPH